MTKSHKSLRLGDLLVEKGLITRSQLREAIEIQQNLQSQRFGVKNINVKTELGEILIELGYLSRHQLHVNLNWQRRLKATTAVMVFIAPLLTAACGGGSGGSPNAATNSGNLTSEISSSAAPLNTLPKPEQGTNSSVASSPQSSAPKLTSSSSSSLSVSSPKSISSSSLSSTSTQSTAIDGAVQLLWNVPTQRENGDYLDVTEIGGYELRYKLKTESLYKTIHITDGFADAYYFDYLKGDYDFQIATFDKTGLYSNFVNINPI